MGRKQKYNGKEEKREAHRIQRMNYYNRQKVIIKKWDKAMFLSECFSGIYKKKCALDLEKLGNLLVGKFYSTLIKVDQIYGESFYAGSLLPLIVRFHAETPNNIPSTEWLCSDFYKYLEKYRGDKTTIVFQNDNKKNELVNFIVHYMEDVKKRYYENKRNIQNSKES